jgi:integrase
VRGGRDRIASPAEAARLVAALPETDRAVWATAVYAGLRLGELQALDWRHVDLKAGVIRVERSYDPRAGYIAPKSRAGTRTVPIAAVLRAELLAHRLRSGRFAGLVFGRGHERTFNPESVNTRARRTWEAAKLAAITMHECRHTCASFLIAAGANAKAVSTILGHANIAITFDRYGHLMPGAEAEVGTQLDAFLTAHARAQPSG